MTPTWSDGRPSAILRATVDLPEPVPPAMPMNNGFTGATLYGAASAVKTACDAQVMGDLLVHDLDALATVERQRLGHGRREVEDAAPLARLHGVDLHTPVAARHDCS